MLDKEQIKIVIKRLQEMLDNDTLPDGVCRDFIAGCVHAYKMVLEIEGE